VQHHGLHRLAHVDDDVGAAGEAVARGVDVEHQPYRTGTTVFGRLPGAVSKSKRPCAAASCANEAARQADRASALGKWRGMSIL
jgi:hypothetical protein